MITINVQSNVRAITAPIEDVYRRQVPFALAQALTQTAKRVQYEEVREMKDVLDRPTPYTLQGVGILPATKTDFSAWVFLKTDSRGIPPDVYLRKLVQGGERGLKPYERMLRAVGVLPDGFFTVPGSAAKIDAFGNMDKGQLTQIVSYFRAFPEAGYKANLTDKRRARLKRGTKAKQGFVYFVGRPADGRLPLGIWQRFGFGIGSAIKPILIFVDSATYEAIFDFYYVAQKTVERDFDRQFRASMIEAVRTAR